MPQRAKVKPIPDGYHTVTPYLTVQDAAQALAFYQKAFGAQETECLKGPDGKILHAEIKIGDSVIMLGEARPEMGCATPASLNAVSVSLYCYVKDVDAAFERAVRAGAKVVMPLQDMFWGDRHGQVSDPWGHRWSLAARRKNLTPTQITGRAQKAFAQNAQAA